MGYVKTVQELVSAKLEHVDQYIADAHEEGGITPTLGRIIDAVESLREAVTLINKAKDENL